MPRSFEEDLDNIMVAEGTLPPREVPGDAEPYEVEAGEEDEDWGEDYEEAWDDQETENPADTVVEFTSGFTQQARVEIPIDFTQAQ